MKKPLICLLMTDAPERLHMAFMLGATAAAMGRPVVFFVSKKATPVFAIGAGSGAVGTEGAQGAKATAGAEGVEGAQAAVGGAGKISGWHAVGGTDYDAHLDACGVADFHVLLDALKALNTRMLVCDASLAEYGLTLADINPTFHAEEAGLASLLEMGQGADWLSF